MAKLYPPVIEGTIPAFNGTELTVPFSMNRSVSTSQIFGFAVKIKTIQSNTWIATINNGRPNADFSAAKFNIESAWTPTPGQFYKLQLAYIDFETRETGYFSTVGVVKYTNVDENNITLQYQNIEMDNEQTYPFAHTYVAVYDYSTDPMEKAYQYKFNLYDSNHELQFTSGWLLHDATKDDTLYTSVDAYTFTEDLISGESYDLNYELITVNGLHITSFPQPVLMSKEIISTYQVELIAENNYDNGYVHLVMHGNNFNEQDPDAEESIYGQFKIYRCDLRNPNQWDPITTFVLRDQKPSTFTEIIDFTVEHGVSYQYKLCQFNSVGIMALCGYSNRIYVDFEDMFLFDGERQLKVRFNPKVSSFKNDILESKMDTIGSKYPFFFRNGVVKYKEFPISGLISYWSDNEELFMPLEELGIQDLDKVRRNITVVNPYIDEDNIKYNYGYDNVSTVMGWVRKIFYTPVNHWIGDRQYYKYNPETKLHEVDPIVPAQQYILDPETGDLIPREPTRAEWEAAFQAERRALKILAWSERLARVGKTIGDYTEEAQEEYLQKDKTPVLYANTGVSDWSLIPWATRRVDKENTPEYEWYFQPSVPEGASARAAALDGYRNLTSKQPKTTDLVNYNIAAERQFKLKVLEWLTNGKPKLFKSPAEGNYIVRLLNTSLVPTDSLGRMLHTFNSTAYEIDDFNYTTLNQYGFIKAEYVFDENDIFPWSWTINLYNLYANKDPIYYSKLVLETDEDGQYYELAVNQLTGRAITPTVLKIQFGTDGDWIKINDERVELWLSPEGYYVLEDMEPSDIYSIKYYPIGFARTGRPNAAGTILDPLVEIHYDAGYSSISEFDSIASVAYELQYRQFMNVTNENRNVILDMEDIRTRVATIYSLTFAKRHQEFLYTDYALSGDNAEVYVGRSFGENDINAHFSFGSTTDDFHGTTVDMLNNQPLYIYKIESAITQGTELSDYGGVVQDSEEEVPPHVDTYVEAYHTLSDLDKPLYAIFDKDNCQLQIVELDTRAYINTGDMVTLSADTRELCDLDPMQHSVVDVGNFEDGEIYQVIQPQTYLDLNPVTDIYIGNGVLMDIVYQALITTYVVEIDHTVAPYKALYEQCVTDLKNARRNYDATIDPTEPENQTATYQHPETLEELTKTRGEWVTYSYDLFIQHLTEYLELWREG